jgi:DNA-binding NarL/FixJ family response regulator
MQDLNVDNQNMVKLQAEIQMLLAQKRELEEKIAALKTLTGQYKKDVDDFKQRVVANVNNLVLPSLDRMKETKLDEDQQVYLGVIRENLSEIIAPFLVSPGLQFSNLTPREIEVAKLVQMGKSSKQVARILRISIRAVDFHIDSLRKKLGLKKAKKNLKAYLAGF